MVPEKIILPEIPASINADIMSEEDLQAKLQAGYDNIEEGKIRLFIEMYEDTMKRLNVYRELEFSEKQIEAGRTQDAREALSDLRDKYAI